MKVIGVASGDAGAMIVTLELEVIEFRLGAVLYLLLTLVVLLLLRFLYDLLARELERDLKLY